MRNNYGEYRRKANVGRPDDWLDGRWVPSDMPFDERDKFWGISPDGESRDGYVWLEYHKNSHRSSRRANRKVASNPLFIRLLASRGVYGVGISGDIMAYVDLPIDENGTNFYWVVIDSNGDEIVGGASSSFEEATSLAETNLFRLSRELYPESYTSHRANRRVARDWEDTIDELLWHFDDVYGEVGDEAVRDFLWGNDSYGLHYEFDAFMESAPPSVREKALSRIKTQFKFLKNAHRANRKVAYDETDLLMDLLNEDISFDTYDSLTAPGGDINRIVLDIYNNADQEEIEEWYYGDGGYGIENPLREYSSYGGIEYGILAEAMSKVIRYNSFGRLANRRRANRRTRP